MTVKPNFIVAGVAKSGTTALYEHLKSIDQIMLGYKKDYKVFSEETNNKKIESKLDANYSRHNSGVIGHFEVKIFKNINISIRNIKGYCPDCKIILMLRNPIERANSAFWYAKKHGFEKLESFDEYIKRNIHLLEKDVTIDSISVKDYLESSLYSKGIKRILEVFGEKNTLLILTENYLENPEKEINRVLDFLNINHNIRNKSILKTKVHEAGFYKNNLINKYYNNNIKKQLLRILPLKTRIILSINLNKTINKYFVKKINKPKISNEMRELLIQYYKKDIIELSSIIKIDLIRIWKFK